MLSNIKKALLLSIISFCMACNNGGANNVALQRKIDSLQLQVNNTYKPGLGEFMYGIQVHHAKLWFAGDAQNWKLADFELNEIYESIGDIRQYCADRPEVTSLGMIAAPLDSLKNAVQSENAVAFRRSFILLTNTCNNCHRATKHEFNVIKVPDMPQFSNQEFKP